MGVLLENVTKSYTSPDGGAVPVLDIRRFELPRGSETVVTGRSGSGKTTLLNVIGGITLPDSGSVRVGGVEVTALTEARRDRFRAERIGYVFQTFNLLPGFSALENVVLASLFAGRVDRPRALALLDQVGLGDRASYKPGALSVGQQQRVAIARALVNRPALVLADEPTGNVDPAAGAAIIDLLRGMCREGGATLLIVTHQPEVVRRFERTIDLSLVSGAAA